MFILFLGILGGCLEESLESSGDSEVDSPYASAVSAPHIRYYGYYGDEGRIDEIADHANLTHVRSSNEDGEIEAQRLALAQSRGLKAMVSVEGVFNVQFDDPDGDGIRTARMRPEAEWRSKWAEFSSRIRPYVDSGTVVAFYMADEPAAEADATYWALQDIAIAAVKQTFPGPKLALGYHFWNVNPRMQNEYPITIPSSLDWVGFNCYGPVEGCGADPHHPASSLTEMIDYLKTKMHSHQQMLLFPEASSWYADVTGTAIDEGALVTRADQYLAIAANEPRVIALITFTWAEGPGFPHLTLSQLGAPLRNKFVSIGRQITTGAPPPPPPSRSGELEPNESLRPGEAVVSTDGRFTLVFQGDGNLVLSQAGVGALWTSNTVGSAGLAAMQGDGNFVVYDASGIARWNSATQGNPGAWLAVQNDGNVVVYSAGGMPLWASGTCCR